MAVATTQTRKPSNEQQEQEHTTSETTMVANFLSLSQHTKERALQARERHGGAIGQQSRNQSARSSRKSSILSSLGKFLDDHNDYGGINDDDDDDHDCLLMNNKNNSSSHNGGDDPTESTYQQSFSDASFLTGASSSPQGDQSVQGHRRAGRRGSVTKFSLDNTNPSASFADTMPEPAASQQPYQHQQQEENGSAHPPARRVQRRGGCTMYVTDKNLDSHFQQQQTQDDSAVPQPSGRIHRRGGCTLYVTNKDVDSDELSVSSAMSAPVTASSSKTAKKKKTALRNAFTGLTLNVKSTHSHQEELHEQHRHSRPPLTNRNLDYSSKSVSLRGHHHQPMKKRLSFNGFQSHLHRSAGGNNRQQHHHGEEEEDDDDCSVGSMQSVQTIQTIQTIDSMPIPMRPKMTTASSVSRPKPLGESLQGLSSQSCHVTPTQTDEDGFPDLSDGLPPSSCAMSVQSTPASSASAAPAITGKTKKKKTKAKTEETKKKTKKATKKTSSTDDVGAGKKTKKKTKTKKDSSPKSSIPSTIGGYHDHGDEDQDEVVGTADGGRRLSVESTLSDVTGGSRRHSGFSHGSGGFVGGDDRRLSVDSTLSMEMSLYEEDEHDDDDDDQAEFFDAAGDKNNSPPRRKNSMKGRRVQRRGSVTKYSLDE